MYFKSMVNKIYIVVYYANCAVDSHWKQWDKDSDAKSASIYVLFV